MPTIEIRTGPFPSKARSVIVEYRHGSRDAWIRLGEFTNEPGELVVRDTGLVEVSVRFRSDKGVASIRRRTRMYNLGSAASNRPAIATVVPAVKVEQRRDGLTFEIAPTVEPQASNGDPVLPVEYALDVRASKVGEDPGDAVELATTAAGRVVVGNLPVDDDEVDVHVRPVRVVDDEVGEWATETVVVQPVVTDESEDHGTDFSGDTILKVGSAGANGIATMEETTPGSGLRAKALYAGDLDPPYAGDLIDIFAGDMCEYYGRAGFETAVVAFPEAIPMVFGGWPDMDTAQARPVLYAGDWDWPICAPRTHVVTSTFGNAGADRFDDGLRDDRDMYAGGDDSPVRPEILIAHSATTESPTFVAEDFVTFVPGKVYNVRAYALRVWFNQRFGRRIKLLGFHWRRKCWCVVCCCDVCECDPVEEYIV